MPLSAFRGWLSLDARDFRPDFFLFSVSQQIIQALAQRSSTFDCGRHDLRQVNGVLNTLRNCDNLSTNDTFPFLADLNLLLMATSTKLFLICRCHYRITFLTAI